MSLELNNVASGYSTGVINQNFSDLEAYINQYLLNRAGLSPGEANYMDVDLDMNSHRILNASSNPDDPGSLLTVEIADQRYVNLTGDQMQGSLNMDAYPLFVRIPVAGNEPSRKDQLDAETKARRDSISRIQAQLTGEVPLESSAFSPISWHAPVIENSVVIPPNKNAWSFGPTMTIAAGQSVTVSEGSHWTIANGELVE